MGALVVERDLPRIVIDGRMVGAIPHGIARYVTSLAKGLAEQRELGFTPVFLTQAGMHDAFAGFETQVVRTPFLDLKESLVLPLVLRRLAPALYHSTSFSSLAFCPCPYAITIHDLNHLQFGGIVEKLYYEAMLKPFLMKAKAVISVSRFTESELARWVPQLRSVTTIPIAVDPGVAPAIPGVAPLNAGFSPSGVHASEEMPPLTSEETARLSQLGVEPGRYFLNLSNAKPHKNLPTLLRAFQQFRARSPKYAGYKLVLSVREYSNEPNVVATGGISEADLRTLLRGAVAAPFPSLYEGFGLPPLEAAAFGVVPLPSRIPPHLEAFEAALGPIDGKRIRYVDPENVGDWVSALVEAADGRLRPLPLAARERIRERYSVRRLGEETKRVYDRLLEATAKPDRTLT